MCFRAFLGFGVSADVDTYVDLQPGLSSVPGCELPPRSVLQTSDASDKAKFYRLYRRRLRRLREDVG